MNAAMRAMVIAVSSWLLLGCGDNDAPSGGGDVALTFAAADNFRPTPCAAKVTL